MVELEQRNPCLIIPMSPIFFMGGQPEIWLTFVGKRRKIIVIIIII